MTPKRNEVSYKNLKSIQLPTKDKSRIRGKLNTTFKSLNQIDNADYEQSFERRKEGVIRYHKKNLFMKYIHQKYFYSIRVVHE